MFYTYILLCSDNKSYIGGTNNLKDRLKRHQLGYIAATRKRLPNSLHAFFAFNNEHTAFFLKNILSQGREERL